MAGQAVASERLDLAEKVPEIVERLEAISRMAGYALAGSVAPETALAACRAHAVRVRQLVEAAS